MCRPCLFVILFGFIFLLSDVLHAGIRCANDIISKGDTTFEVELKLKECGEVIDKQVIRKESVKKNDVEKRKEETYIDRWYIRVREQGGKYCYPLVFEEGVLKEIGNWKRCH